MLVLLSIMEEQQKNDATRSGRILGIDYGKKRVGVAVSDEKRQFALPVSVVLNTGDLVVEIEKLAIDHESKTIVLGESRNYKNEPNDIYLESLEFKADLEGRGFEVIFEPEFMTSHAAERFQGKNDLSDASAAALILQSYLDKNKQL